MIPVLTITGLIGLFIVVRVVNTFHKDLPVFNEVCHSPHEHQQLAACHREIGTLTRE